MSAIGRHGRGAGADPPRPLDDAGTVAVLVQCGGAVLLGLGLVVLAVVADVAVAAAQARTAADAAALAAVGSLPASSGGGDACAAARQLARANGAALRRCVLRQTVPDAGAASQPAVEVEVEVLPSSPAGRAIAGPLPARAAAALRRIDPAVPP